MKQNLPSIFLGSLSTVLIDLNGAGITEAIIVAFIGGAVGYLAKLLTELIVKKIKKLLK